MLTGSPPAFCAGSDLKELGGLSVRAMCVHEEETAAIARKIGYLPKPVIAAVEGYALGGGFILAASCDVIVSAADARWHLPEVVNGWLPPWGLQTLIARVGPVKARLLTWGAEPLDGEAAHKLGLVDYLAPPQGALVRAQELAAGLASLPANAVASTKLFFEPFVMADGERLDLAASRIFAADCLTPAARTTLAKFATPA